MRVYRKEDGWWVSYEWYVSLLTSVWYSGYEFESSHTWLNMDYPLLSGHLLIAELLFAPWGEELMYDRFRVYVGERFYVQKVKRRPHYLKRHPDEPPPVYLPPNEPSSEPDCEDICSPWGSTADNILDLGEEIGDAILPPADVDGAAEAIWCQECFRMCMAFCVAFGTEFDPNTDPGFENCRRISHLCD